MKHIHILHYIVLIFILVGGCATFLFVAPDTYLQLIVGVIVSISYVVWGIIHHAIEKELHQKIVVEYLLIGTIAIVLLATILRS